MANLITAHDRAGLREAVEFTLNHLHLDLPPTVRGAPQGGRPRG